MSAPLNFTVSHVTSKDDFPGIVAVEKAAFRSSQMLALMLPPDPSSPVNFASTVHNHEKSWASDPNAKYLKAALPDGKIIGMAKWYFFLNGEVNDPWKIDFPPGANEELYNLYFGALNKARLEKLGGKRHIFMAILVIDPEYQRKGVGHELLRWGLEQADEEQVECWIDASAAGHGLYKQLGWEDVGEVVVDLRPYGGNAPSGRGVVNMMRQPKAKK